MVHESLSASAPYLRGDLSGEAVLTIGGPTYEHAHDRIDGVVIVGPLECMPNKISEAQFFHVAEEQGLLSLSLSLRRRRKAKNERAERSTSSVDSESWAS